MGALTFKPNALTHRPWERRALRVDDRYVGTSLTAGVVGGRVVRLAGGGWLRDTVRFSHDGYRRQRLRGPHVFGRSVSWRWSFSLWMGLLHGSSLAVAVGFGRRFVAPLVKNFRLWTLPGADPVWYLFDLNRRATLFQAPFGLTAARRSYLAFPARLELEEEGLTGPRGVPEGAALAAGFAQLFVPDRGYTWHASSGLWLAGDHPPRMTRSLYQVSPLVNLLHRAAT